MDLIEIIAKIFTVVATALLVAPIVVWTVNSIVNHYFGVKAKLLQAVVGELTGMLDRFKDGTSKKDEKQGT